ncbi:hypothetical protein L211DRAFT_832986 [Terfezia boudieri ATCC MYA-4762]|uniref:Uncharacterized protein n=1 Tax=Terfezia boudieri ATCC MYA-4762 TaxID=1051890 RepID=A0A3N4M253_9PEZI|nr:hypothetical protein L211DRAFT_832986 [Terfezia boudieri ATCC MYA-4762]
MLHAVVNAPELQKQIIEIIKGDRSLKKPAQYQKIVEELVEVHPQPDYPSSYFKSISKRQRYRG